jgi:hypothetical protein
VNAAEVRAKVGRASDATAEKAAKILLRVFFCTSGRRILLLLSGYDKARDSSGNRQEIDKARKLLTAHREAEKRAEKRSQRA